MVQKLCSQVELKVVSQIKPDFTWHFISENKWWINSTVAKHSMVHVVQLLEPSAPTVGQIFTQKSYHRRASTISYVTCALVSESSLANWCWLAINNERRKQEENTTRWPSPRLAIQRDVGFWMLPPRSGERHLSECQHKCDGDHQSDARPHRRRRRLRYTPCARWLLRKGHSP